MKKYLKWILLAAALLVSIKPFLFTWNFIQAGYSIHRNSKDAGKYMNRAISFKPSVYRIFNEAYPMGFENYWVKNAIYHHDPARLPSTPGMNKFDDNFYVQHLVGKIDTRKYWENLDETSLELLADPGMNESTIAVLNKIAPVLDKSFISNLADYAMWKGNKRLSMRLGSTYSSQTAPADYKTSLAYVKALLGKRYGIKENDLGENLIKCGDFQDTECVETRWFFSKMATSNAFSKGSFTMGPDKVGKNTVMRVMGFFAGNEPRKYPPRAGVRFLKRIPAENGFYVFSFDYYIHTGNETPTVWLAKGLNEERLPRDPGKWKNVLITVNNSSNLYEFFQPLIRMWGTGTMWIDNVFFCKISKPGFSIPTPVEILIEGR